MFDSRRGVWRTPVVVDQGPIPEPAATVSAGRSPTAPISPPSSNCPGEKGTALTQPSKLGEGVVASARRYATHSITPMVSVQPGEQRMARPSRRLVPVIGS
jgi:hypothetical protein